jgi:uncharacterized membrane protein
MGLDFILAIAAFIMAIVALRKISALTLQLRKAREIIDQLRSDVVLLKTKGLSEAAEESVAAPAQEARQEAGAPDVASFEARPDPSREMAAEPALDEPISSPPIPPRRSLEQMLAGKWFVVVGGIAVALGGLLFIKYAHDNGLLPPWLRVLFGYVFAGALVAGGEYVRRSRPGSVSDLVPAALSAAGVIVAFGVTYAAYALYNLMSPGLCFPLLVAIGLAALWLSRRQGPLIAALGLIGSYAAPALVPSDNPNAWGFFAYLIVVLAASLYELRSRPWWWLGYAAIAGSLAWALLWLNGGLFERSHVVPASVFAYLLAIAAAFVPRGMSMLRDDVGTLAVPRLASQALLIAAAGAAAGALILQSTVMNAKYALAALLFFAIGMAAITAFGWLKSHRNIAAVLAAAFTWLVFMLWPDVSEPMWAFDERGFWALVPQLIEPPRFVRAMLAAWAAFTALGVAGLLMKAEQRYWNALAAGSAVLFLFGAWAKADFAMPNMGWLVCGAVGAVALLGAARMINQRGDSDHRALTLWMLLPVAALLLLFAADRAFDDVWYTLAIAALMAGFAYASRLYQHRAPGWIAVAFATLATVRLFAGREFWLEPTGLPLGQHWALYGYGVPALLALWATRQPVEARQKVALEGISLGLLISMVSVELRVLIGGGIGADDISVAELGSHVTAWLGAALGLAYRQSVYSSFISRWGAVALVAMSSVVLIGLLTVANPALTGDGLAGGAVLNGLWLAYLFPAILLAMLVNWHDLLKRSPQREALSALAMVLLVAFLTLMVMRFYQGPFLRSWFRSDAESYTVSLAWLITGVAAFVAGLRFDRPHVRLGGLVLLILTVLKVFILDFADLSGLWRIASLMGLGFCLIGIGWLYTRFVQRPKQAESVS